MKIIILALSVMSVTCLQYPLQYSYHPYDYQVDAYAKPQPYNFGYDIHNEYGDRQWQQEQGDEYGNKQGSYGYADAYGISRQVDYIADEGGFRANVKTNEPGTANQNPADVNIYSDVVPVKYDARPYGYAHPYGYARPVAYGYARPAHSHVPRAVY